MRAVDRLPQSRAEFRFYEELNAFLAPALRKRAFAYAFDGTPSVKDAIEAIGVPHTEVDLVLVDGESVDFTRRLAGDERVAVYPVFERLDISPVTRLRARPLRRIRFVLDARLGELARSLRMLGFDTCYRSDYDDDAIVALARAESRIILTRDSGLLNHEAVTHGYRVRATAPRRQLAEIVRVFDLGSSVRPFTRCPGCNGELQRESGHANHEVPMDPPTKLPDTAQRVADLLVAMGHDRPVIMLPESGKTSAEAAAGLGCNVAEIAKSIVFRRLSDDAPVMVIASGANRVDERKIGALVGEVRKADAKFAKERTGFAIGGVAPIGHPGKTHILVDEDLLQLTTLWAAAGHPHAVFSLTPKQLLEMTGANAADVALRTDVV